MNGGTLQLSSDVTVGATAQTGLGAVQPSLIYHIEVDGTVFSAPDNSSPYPPPGMTSTDSTYYTLTSHKPQTLTTAPNMPIHHIPAGHNGSGYYIADWYYLNLFDHLGSLMPSVWVQERFPNGTQSNFSGAPEFIPNLTVNSNAVYWITDANGNMGPDQLSCTNIQNSHPYPGTAIWDLLHEYWAGTRNTAVGGDGILVGTYQLKIWTNKTQQ